MPNRTKILPLTSVRFIAAFMIVLAHSAATGIFGFAFGTPTQFTLGAGVSFFFVLSGFIITYTYGRLETNAAMLNFWGARFARIWPAHALAFLICIALIPSGEWALGGPTVLPAIANITLTHAIVPIPQYYFSFNAPSWSISTEAYFYLLYPLALRSMAWKPWAPVLGGALGVASMITLSVVLGLPEYGADSLMHATSHGMISISPATCFLQFACGMYAATLWKPLKERVNIGAAASTLLEVAAVGVAALSVISFQDLASSLEARQWPYAFTLWLRFGASTIPMAAFILVLSLERGYLSKILSVRPLVILGEISFAMYMLHQLALRHIQARGVDVTGGPNWWMFAAFCLFITLLSYLVWALIERPSRRSLYRLLYRAGPGEKLAVSAP